MTNFYYICTQLSTPFPHQQLACRYYPPVSGAESRMGPTANKHLVGFLYDIFREATDAHATHSDKQDKPVNKPKEPGLQRRSQI